MALLLVRRGIGKDTASAPPAPKVTVAAVEERSITEYVELTGRVDAVESVEIRLRVFGHIQEVHLHADQLVQPGAILFVIDPRSYQAQADLAAAEVARTRAMSVVAEREAQRADELLAARTISKEDADSRRLRNNVSKSAVRSAEATLANAQLDLEFIVVRSPIAGRVSRAMVTAGILGSGATTSPTLLTTIVSAGGADVHVDTDESTALAFNRLVRAGTMAGADGRVPITAPHSALLISEYVIGTDQSQKFVFTVSADGETGRRPVKLGGTIGGLRIVRSGLQAGDKVVVNGLQRARPGDAVAPESATSVPVVANCRVQVDPCRRHSRRPKPHDHF